MKRGDRRIRNSECGMRNWRFALIVGVGRGSPHTDFGEPGCVSPPGNYGFAPIGLWMFEGGNSALRKSETSSGWRPSLGAFLSR